MIFILLMQIIFEGIELSAWRKMWGFRAPSSVIKLIKFDFRSIIKFELISINSEIRIINVLM